jgi:TRAP-type C4-dicarboxylate transport system substrate-binding protein
MQCGRFAARCLAAAICLSAALLAGGARAQAPVTLHGASQYGGSHASTRTLVRFEELVRKYYGKPVEFVLYQDSSLGLERQYFEFMSQGTTVDYAIVSPAHMAGASRSAHLIGAPFLFRDGAHWRAALAGNALGAFAEEVAAKANVRIVGFAGGTARHIVARKPAGEAGLKGVKIRLPALPLWSEAFAAAGMAPASVGVNEVYGAIQKGSIEAAEGDAAGIEAMKLYEVAPNVAMTAHAVAIRPICFSAATFKKLPPELQQAILKAGAEAAAYGREIEEGEDSARLDAMIADGRLKRVPLEDRAAMKALADPVLAAFAKEIGAEALLGAIEAAK